MKKLARLFIEKNFKEVYQPRLYGDSYWYQTSNLWEPTVQLALKDLCKPGSTVFDVGANVGGITSVMSRLVGPRGIVCSFEASPRIVGYLQANVSKQGHHNVTVFHNAVYSKSEELLPIYPGNHLNDSIYQVNEEHSRCALVQSVALDDFVQATNLVPDLIKMDIEGAEYDALRGAAGVINKYRPHLILEQQANDSRCLDFLKRHQYLAMDLSTYRQIHTLDDFPRGTDIRNVLFIHSARAGEIGYTIPPGRSLSTKLYASDFQMVKRGIRSKEPVRLMPGRYVIETEFSAEGVRDQLMGEVISDSEVIFRNHGIASMLAESYRDWVIHLTKDSYCSLQFIFPGRVQKAALQIHGITITRLECPHPPAWSRYSACG
ncbi:MAG: FkbM family methyltransferase [Pseudomonadota bacterium]